MLKEYKKEIKEFIGSYEDPKEMVGDCVGWVCLFAIVFMLSIVGY